MGGGTQTYAVTGFDWEKASQRPARNGLCRGGIHGNRHALEAMLAEIENHYGAKLTVKNVQLRPGNNATTSLLLDDTTKGGKLIADFSGYRARPSLSELLVWATYWGVVLFAWRRTSHG